MDKLTQDAVNNMLGEAQMIGDWGKYVEQANELVSDLDLIAKTKSEITTGIKKDNMIAPTVKKHILDLCSSITTKLKKL